MQLACGRIPDESLFLPTSGSLLIQSKTAQKKYYWVRHSWATIAVSPTSESSKCERADTEHKPLSFGSFYTTFLRSNQWANLGLSLYEVTPKSSIQNFLESLCRDTIFFNTGWIKISAENLNRRIFTFIFSPGRLNPALRSVDPSSCIPDMPCRIRRRIDSHLAGSEPVMKSTWGSIIRSNLFFMAGYHIIYSFFYLVKQFIRHIFLEYSINFYELSIS